MSDLKTCGKLPQQELEVWEGGPIKLPFWIMDDEEKPYRPILAIWVDADNGHVVCQDLRQELPSSQESLALLLKTMAKPMMGLPRRPTHIRVKDKAFADFIIDELGSIGITVELVDRFTVVDILIDKVRKMMESEDEDAFEAMPGLLDLEGITPERVAAFFHAAATYYKLAPWRFVADSHPLEISGPELFRSPVYITVMGNGGIEYGLGLFENLEELERMYELPPGTEIRRMSVRTASVLFSDPTFVCFADLDAIEQYGWQVAGPEAYPHLFQILPEREPPFQPPSPWQVDVFEACLLALPQIVKKHKADLKAERPFEENVAVDTFHGKWQLNIAAPPRAWQR